MKLWVIEAIKNPLRTQIELYRRDFIQILTEVRWSLHIFEVEVEWWDSEHCCEEELRNTKKKKEGCAKEALVKCLELLIKQNWRKGPNSKRNVWEKMIDFSAGGNQEDGYLSNRITISCVIKLATYFR